MKKHIIFLLLILCTIIQSCSNTEDLPPKKEPTDEELPFVLPDIPCSDWNIQVNIAKYFRFVNNEGDWTDKIDFEKLSLAAVDKNGSQIVGNYNIPIVDLENLAEIIKNFNNTNQIESLFLKFGYIYKYTDFNYAVSYFKLTLNENRTDNITIYYDTRCANLLIYKIIYNGTEYTPDDFSTIDIIIE